MTHYLNKYKRTLSGILAVLFLLQNTASYAGSLEASAPPAEIRLSAFNPEIPEKWGTVGEIFHAPGSVSWVVHLNDAHANYEAQRNLREIIRFLHEKYGFKLLFLEGGSGALEPSLIRYFKKARLNRKVWKLLMKKGELSGAEEALAGSGLRGYGIEDIDAYRKDLERFREVIREEKRSQSWLEEMEVSERSLENRFFSKELKRFAGEWRQFESKESSLVRFSEILSKQARRTLAVDIEKPEFQFQYPGLIRLRKLSGIEKELKEDDEGIRSEKQKLIETLEKKGSLEKEISQLKRIESLKRPRFFFERLDEEFGGELDLRSYPAFARYAEHLILRSEIEGPALFRETDQLTEQILDRLASSPQEKKVLGLLRQRMLLGKLFSLELTREEYQKLEAGKTGSRPSVYLRNAAEMGAPVSGLKGEVADTFYDSAIDFYREACGREVHFMRNLFEEMKASGETKVILVTGGFHSEGVKAGLKAKGLSYLQISPRILKGQEGQETIYKRAMLGDALKTSEISNVLQVMPLNEQRRMGAITGERLTSIEQAVGKVLAEGKGGDSALEEFQQSLFVRNNRFSVRQAGNRLILEGPAALKAASLGSENAERKIAEKIENIRNVFERAYPEASAAEKKMFERILKKVTGSYRARMDKFGKVLKGMDVLEVTLKILLKAEKFSPTQKKELLALLEQLMKYSRKESPLGDSDFLGPFDSLRKLLYSRSFDPVKYPEVLPLLTRIVPDATWNAGHTIFNFQMLFRFGRVNERNRKEIFPLIERLAPFLKTDIALVVNDLRSLSRSRAVDRKNQGLVYSEFEKTILLIAGQEKIRKSDALLELEYFTQSPAFTRENWQKVFEAYQAYLNMVQSYPDKKAWKMFHALGSVLFEGGHVSPENFSDMMRDLTGEVKKLTDRPEDEVFDALETLLFRRSIRPRNYPRVYQELNGMLESPLKKEEPYFREWLDLLKDFFSPKFSRTLTEDSIFEWIHLFRAVEERTGKADTALAVYRSLNAIHHWVDEKADTRFGIYQEKLFPAMQAAVNQLEGDAILGAFQELQEGLKTLEDRPFDYELRGAGASLGDEDREAGETLVHESFLKSYPEGVKPSAEEEAGLRKVLDNVWRFSVEAREAAWNSLAYFFDPKKVSDELGPLVQFYDRVELLELLAKLPESDPKQTYASIQYLRSLLREHQKHLRGAGREELLAFLQRVPENEGTKTYVTFEHLGDIFNNGAVTSENVSEFFSVLQAADDLKKGQIYPLMSTLQETLYHLGKWNAFERISLRIWIEFVLKRMKRQEDQETFHRTSSVLKDIMIEIGERPEPARYFEQVLYPQLTAIVSQMEGAEILRAFKKLDSELSEGKGEAQGYELKGEASSLGFGEQVTRIFDKRFPKADEAEKKIFGKLVERLNAIKSRVYRKRSFELLKKIITARSFTGENSEEILSLLSGIAKRANRNTPEFYDIVREVLTVKELTPADQKEIFSLLMLVLQRSGWKLKFLVEGLQAFLLSPALETGSDHQGLKLFFLTQKILFSMGTANRMSVYRRRQFLGMFVRTVLQGKKSHRAKISAIASDSGRDWLALFRKFILRAGSSQDMENGFDLLTKIHEWSNENYPERLDRYRRSVLPSLVSIINQSEGAELVQSLQELLNELEQPQGDYETQREAASLGRQEVLQEKFEKTFPWLKKIEKEYVTSLLRFVEKEAGEKKEDAYQALEEILDDHGRIFAPGALISLLLSVPNDAGESTADQFRQIHKVLQSPVLNKWNQRRFLEALWMMGNTEEDFEGNRIGLGSVLTQAEAWLGSDFAGKNSQLAARWFRLISRHAGPEVDYALRVLLSILSSGEKPDNSLVRAVEKILPLMERVSGTAFNGLKQLLEVSEGTADEKKEILRVYVEALRQFSLLVKDLPSWNHHEVMQYILFSFQMTFAWRKITAQNFPDTVHRFMELLSDLKRRSPAAMKEALAAFGTFDMGIPQRLFPENPEKSFEWIELFSQMIERTRDLGERLQIYQVVGQIHMQVFGNYSKLGTKYGTEIFPRMREIVNQKESDEMIEALWEVSNGLDREAPEDSYETVAAGASLGQANDLRQAVAKMYPDRQAKERIYFDEILKNVGQHVRIDRRPVYDELQGLIDSGVLRKEIAGDTLRFLSTVPRYAGEKTAAVMASVARLVKSGQVTVSSQEDVFRFFLVALRRFGNNAAETFSTITQAMLLLPPKDAVSIPSAIFKMTNSYELLKSLNEVLTADQFTQMERVSLALQLLLFFEAFLKQPTVFWSNTSPQLVEFMRAAKISKETKKKVLAELTEIASWLNKNAEGSWSQTLDTVFLPLQNPAFEGLNGEEILTWLGATRKIFERGGDPSRARDLYEGDLAPLLGTSPSLEEVAIIALLQHVMDDHHARLSQFKNEILPALAETANQFEGNEMYGELGRLAKRIIQPGTSGPENDYETKAASLGEEADLKRSALEEMESEGRKEAVRRSFRVAFTDTQKKDEEALEDFLTDFEKNIDADSGISFVSGELSYSDPKKQAYEALISFFYRLPPEAERYKKEILALLAALPSSETENAVTYLATLGELFGAEEIGSPKLENLLPLSIQTVRGMKEDGSLLLQIFEVFLHAEAVQNGHYPDILRDFQETIDQMRETSGMNPLGMLSFLAFLRSPAFRSGENLLEFLQLWKILQEKQYFSNSRDWKWRNGAMLVWLESLFLSKGMRGENWQEVFSIAEDLTRYSKNVTYLTSIPEVLDHVQDWNYSELKELGSFILYVARKGSGLTGKDEAFRALSALLDSKWTRTVDRIQLLRRYQNIVKKVLQHSHGQMNHVFMALTEFFDSGVINGQNWKEMFQILYQLVDGLKTSATYGIKILPELISGDMSENEKQVRLQMFKQLVEDISKKVSAEKWTALRHLYSLLQKTEPPVRGEIFPLFYAVSRNGGEQTSYAFKYLKRILETAMFKKSSDEEKISVLSLYRKVAERSETPESFDRNYRSLEKLYEWVSSQNKNQRAVLYKEKIFPRLSDLANQLEGTELSAGIEKFVDELQENKPDDELSFELWGASLGSEKVLSRLPAELAAAHQKEFERIFSNIDKHSKKEAESAYSALDSLFFERRFVERLERMPDPVLTLLFQTTRYMGGNTQALWMLERIFTHVQFDEKGWEVLLKELTAVPKQSKVNTYQIFSRAHYLLRSGFAVPENVIASVSVFDILPSSVHDLFEHVAIAPEKRRKALGSFRELVEMILAETEVRQSADVFRELRDLFISIPVTRWMDAENPEDFASLLRAIVSTGKETSGQGLRTLRALIESKRFSELAVQEKRLEIEFFKKMTERGASPENLMVIYAEYVQLLSFDNALPALRDIVNQFEGAELAIQMQALRKRMEQGPAAGGDYELQKAQASSLGKGVEEVLKEWERQRSRVLAAFKEAFPKALKKDKRPLKEAFRAFEDALWKSRAEDLSEVGNSGYEELAQLFKNRHPQLLKHKEAVLSFLPSFLSVSPQDAQSSIEALRSLIENGLLDAPRPDDVLDFFGMAVRAIRTETHSRKAFPAAMKAFSYFLQSRTAREENYATVFILFQDFVRYAASRGWDEEKIYKPLAKIFKTSTFRDLAPKEGSVVLNVLESVLNDYRAEDSAEKVMGFFLGFYQWVEGLPSKRREEYKKIFFFLSQISYFTEKGTPEAFQALDATFHWKRVSTQEILEVLPVFERLLRSIDANVKGDKEVFFESINQFTRSSLYASAVHSEKMNWLALIENLVLRSGDQATLVTALKTLSKVPTWLPGNNEDWREKKAGLLPKLSALVNQLEGNSILEGLQKLHESLKSPVVAGNDYEFQSGTQGASLGGDLEALREEIWNSYKKKFPEDTGQQQSYFKNLLQEVTDAGLSNPLTARALRAIQTIMGSPEINQANHYRLIAVLRAIVRYESVSDFGGLLEDLKDFLPGLFDGASAQLQKDILSFFFSALRGSGKSRSSVLSTALTVMRSESLTLKDKQAIFALLKKKEMHWLFLVDYFSAFLDQIVSLRDFDHAHWRTILEEVKDFNEVIWNHTSYHRYNYQDNPRDQIFYDLLAITRSPEYVLEEMRLYQKLMERGGYAMDLKEMLKTLREIHGWVLKDKDNRFSVYDELIFPSLSGIANQFEGNEILPKLLELKNKILNPPAAVEGDYEAGSASLGQEIPPSVLSYSKKNDRAGSVAILNIARPLAEGGLTDSILYLPDGAEVRDWYLTRLGILNATANVPESVKVFNEGKLNEWILNSQRSASGKDPRQPLPVILSGKLLDFEREDAGEAARALAKTFERGDLVIAIVSGKIPAMIHELHPLARKQGFRVRTEQQALAAAVLPGLVKDFSSTPLSLSDTESGFLEMKTKTVKVRFDLSELKQAGVRASQVVALLRQLGADPESYQKLGFLFDAVTQSWTVGSQFAARLAELYETFKAQSQIQRAA